MRVAHRFVVRLPVVTTAWAVVMGCLGASRKDVVAVASSGRPFLVVVVVVDVLVISLENAVVLVFVFVMNHAVQQHNWEDVIVVVKKSTNATVL